MRSKEDNHSWYIKKKDKIMKRSREYHQNNKEKIHNKKKEYYQKNKERFQQKHKEHYQNNKEKYIEWSRNWRENNKEKVKQISKRRRLKNPIKTKAREYSRNHKLRDNKCSNCESNENLHYHHTDYEKNEGFTLCINCHNQLHKSNEALLQVTKHGLIGE